jgi:hypothetical protein
MKFFPIKGKQAMDRAGDATAAIHNPRAECHRGPVHLRRQRV